MIYDLNKPLDRGRFAVRVQHLMEENPDVWGYDGCYSAVIEVKTSHSDFLSDKKNTKIYNYRYQNTTIKPQKQ